MEPEGSVPLSQQPANCSYPEIDQSTPRSRIFFLYDTF
jgi:hypothetical protein